MNKTNNDLWSRRILVVCGTAISVLIYGFVVTGVVMEARQMWREGSAAFFADAGLRLGGGALFAIISAAPYVLLARAVRQLGMHNFFATTGVLTFAIQLWLTINALFFGRTSTASIGVLVLPLYLCVAIAAIWGVASLVRTIQSGRTPR